MKLDDDDFALFGLPARFALDRAELDARWRVLQSEVHPDRFVREGGAAHRVAMQWAVRVNEAYRRLKDPIARAGYLCGLRGVPVDAQSNTAMPAAFLARQMAWREALDEAPDATAVERLDAEVAGHEAQSLDVLRVALDERGDVQAAAALVRSLMFVARFRDDVRRRLEALDA
jgi:molecular chaperone HscB